MILYEKVGIMIWRNEFHTLKKGGPDAVRNAWDVKVSSKIALVSFCWKTRQGNLWHNYVSRVFFCFGVFS